jgi:uncharacterized membrane protein YqaE (UPF0057 family)
MSGYDFCCYITAIFLPPLAVFMKRGIHFEFWLNILLTILGWLPGVIHAFYIIHKFKRASHWAPRFVHPPTANTGVGGVGGPPAGTAYRSGF